MTRKIGALSILTLAATGLAIIGYWMLFSSFAIWDDEGYILISAREYLAHGKLYEGVYSQYGPAFYVAIDLFQRVLGAPVDHTWARLLTLTLWLGTAGCSALLVRRETGSRSLSLFTLATVFLYLYFIVDEPFHPGSLIFFVLAAAVHLTTRLLALGQLKVVAFVLGCAGTILLLTKINVGVFFLAGVIGWGACHAVSDPLRLRARPWIFAAYLVLAVGLMHTLVQETWVQIYLALFACGAAALIRTFAVERLINRTHAVLFITASVSLAFIILALIWVRGTSPSGLLDGVLFGPLRHPGNYSYPVDWRPGGLLLAIISLGLALSYPKLCMRFPAELIDRAIVTLRLAQAAGLLVAFALLINYRVVGAIFTYLAPLIWIWVIPLRTVEQAPAARAGRSLLATILLLQYLHAYPVGGSQESWGTFLFFPLVALGLDDVRQWLTIRRAADPSLAHWWPKLSSLVAIVVIAKVGWTGLVAHRNYSGRTALGLPGATELHLDAGLRTAYRIVALNAAAHTDVLFSLPGMFSFNVWTGLPTPTSKNTTLWFTLLNNEEQKAIIQTLEQTPRAGLIVQEALIDLMQTNHVPLRGALWDYLHQNFGPTFKTEGFAFFVPKGRTIAPLNIATVSVLPASERQDGQLNAQLEFNLAHDGTPIAAIEIGSGEPGEATATLLNERNSAISVTAITSAGQPLQPIATVAWPLKIKGFIRVLIRFDRGHLTLSPTSTILYLKGQSGEGIGEVRIGE